MELLGFIPLFQGPRYDSVASMRLAKSLGLSVKFLAGFTDADTAHTMKLVGLDGEALSCEDGALRPAIDSFNAEVSKRVETVSGFADVFPEDKEQIVRTLQSRGHAITIVDDGIRDSPALKIASCGIAADRAKLQLSILRNSCSICNVLVCGLCGAIIPRLQATRPRIFGG